MKKILCLILVALSLFSFTACNKKVDTVTVNLPAMFVGDTDKDSLKSYCEANGYISGTYNKKSDTVALVMTENAYSLQLVSIGMKVIKSMYNVLDEGTFPYFKEIKSYSDDFTQVKIVVDGEAYKADKTSSLLAMTIGETCLMYGMYTVNDDPKCTVIVLDGETNVVLDTKTFDTKGGGAPSAE